jgi:hypothetical protein
MANEAAGTTDLNGNGSKRKLDIPKIDSAGRLVGAKAYGNNISGFWDEDATKITFVRSTKAGDPSGDQGLYGILVWCRCGG